jgi:ABC-type multidrug transport system fused ATPase/permease subunit
MVAMSRILDSSPLWELTSVLGPVRPILRWQSEALAVTLAITGLSLAHPLFLKYLVDAISAGSSARSVLTIGGAFAIYQVVRGALSIAARERTVHVGQRVSLRVRQRLYRHVLSLCPVTHPGTARGDLLFRLTGDVRAVEILFTRVFVQAIGVVVAILGALLGLILLDWRLAFLAVLTIPLFLAVTRRGQRQLRARAQEAQASQGRLTALLSERLAALEAIHVARRERTEARTAFRAGRVGFEGQMAQARANARLWGGVEVVTGLTTAAVLTAGAVAVTQGLLSLGSLLAFHLYVQHLFSAIDTAAALAASATESLAGVHRVAELLAHSPTVKPGHERALAGPGGGLAVECLGVSFAYPGGERVLDGLSFRIAPGEHVAIVGPSGCGKSTLARMLARLFDPHAGRVFLDGQELRTLDLHTLRRAVIVIPQIPAIFAGTLEENITFSRRAPRDAVIEAARRACMDPDLVARLGDRGAGESGANLSGGQRQRLALARLFLEDPRVLVLDEPTSSVDACTEGHLWDSILDFADGRTLIAVTHSLHVASRFPRVLVLEGGRLVRDGTPDVALAAGVLSWPHEGVQDGWSEAAILHPRPLGSPQLEVAR